MLEGKKKAVVTQYLLSQSSSLDCLLRREPIMRCDAIKSSQQSLFGLSISQTWIQAQ